MHVIIIIIITVTIITIIIITMQFITYIITFICMLLLSLLLLSLSSLSSSSGSSTREELDARKSTEPSVKTGTTLAEEANGWQEVEAHFNNPEVVYQNKCISYDEHGNVVLDTRGQRVCSNPIYEGIFVFVKDLNPNLTTDPPAVHRDTAWIKKYTAHLKAKISRAYANFMKSGNQDGTYENLANDWLKDVNFVNHLYQFTDNVNQIGNDRIATSVVVYSLVFLDQQEIMEVGKMIADGIDGDDNSSTTSKTNRSTKNKSKKKRGRDSDGDTVVVDDDDDDNNHTSGATAKTLVEQRRNADLLNSLTLSSEVILSNKQFLSAELFQKATEHLTSMMNINVRYK